MLNRISLALIVALVAPATAWAAPPSVATLDADARASGNRLEIAERVGHALFATQWPAQVMKVSANAVAGSVVVGLRVSGVKFHKPLTRTAFEGEMIGVIARTFAADPAVTEVDLWVAVPLTVGKGVIVSGDLATPISRNVFTVSARREESPAALAMRIKAKTGTYWDEEWARATLKAEHGA